MAPNPLFPSRGIARPGVSAALPAACALVVTACGSSEKSDGSGGTSAASTTQVTDATGTEVKVPARPERAVALGEMDLDSALTLGVEPVGPTAGRRRTGAPSCLVGQPADEQVLTQLRKNAPKATYKQLSAVQDKHTTVIDGSKWTSLGGAEAAVSVLDDIRKAMVK